ncbi:hypothetical protein QZH41_000676 [Actinostola sp. cb2023]|nr:hypothetical protein QZH41_000676 [Actinostola sp. cb2023]
MEIAKIHRGITFHESDWLKKYINLNTELRTAAKNDFEKDFFKLMNNSVFGKTMENIRNRQDIKLVTTEKQAAKLISQPNYCRRTIFSEHLCAIHLIKTELVFNKPVYLGMAILDLSKALMYDFHYNYFKKKFRNTSALLFTDTDSLMYEVESDDFYKDIQDDIVSRFDTSAYPKEHPIGQWVNKKVIGMMKDETAAEGEITEFVGLRSKLYAYKTEDKEEKKCKGIKKAVVKKDLDFDDYKTCLFSGVKVMRKMNVIRSDVKKLPTKEVDKYFNRYQTVLGNKITQGLVSSTLELAVGLASYAIPIDNTKELCEDLKANEVLTQELNNIAGYLLLKGGRMVALSSCLVQVAKHVNFAPSSSIRGGINFDWGGVAYDVFKKEIGGPVHHYDGLVERALTKALGKRIHNGPLGNDDVPVHTHFPKELEMAKTSYPVVSTPFDKAPPSFDPEEIDIYVKPSQKFTIKPRNIFTGVLKHVTQKEAHKWLGGPDMTYYPQQLAFSVWCASSGCGVGTDMLTKIFSYDKFLAQISHPLHLQKDIVANEYSTTWRSILYEHGQ